MKINCLRKMKWYAGIIFGIAVMLSAAFPMAGQTVQGDTLSAEYWRQKGYEAKLTGDVELSLQSYLKVLAIAPADWDAHLAVARVFFAKGTYEDARHHYLGVVAADSTNTEALWGIGRCSYRTGKFPEAAEWYRKTLHYLPGHYPLLEDLSYALINSGKTDEALEIFLKMTKAEPGEALAWAGAGKILMASGKPAGALPYLKKAVALDPGNEEIKAQLKSARGAMAFTVSYQLMYINEREPIDIGNDTAAYNIGATVQVLGITKRVSDRLILRFGHLLDHSNREYYQQETEKRWYDHTYLKGQYMFNSHQFGLHLGGSVIEDRMTTYGLAWDYGKRINKVKVSNTFSAGYDYYYYWNQVGHDYVSDILRFTWGNLLLEGSYRYVNVRTLQIISETDTIGRNPGVQYSLSGKYTFFKNPKITVGIYHQYRDYKYRSKKYWAPQERDLNGATLTVYWDSGKRLYGYVSGNIGRDSYDIEHWEASGELGYNHPWLSISVGASRFYNPWYENFIGYLSLSKKLVKP